MVLIAWEASGWAASCEPKGDGLLPTDDIPRFHAFAPQRVASLQHASAPRLGAPPFGAVLQIDEHQEIGDMNLLGE